MTGTVCFTSFTWSYVPRARVLAATLRAAHPDWRLWAVLVDRPPGTVSLPTAFASFDRVLLADELDIPNFRSWLFKHELVEACTAVKGAMLQRLLSLGAREVVYLDPDVAVFHPLHAVTAALQEAEIVLTPHQTVPSAAAGARRDNEDTSLRYGIFNLGFLAVRDGPHGRAFSHWWAARLYEACYDEPEHGLFTDQKYCDLVPALFSDVAVLRHPGCNAASWNIAHRMIDIDRDGAITVDRLPLQFYHFSKSDGAGEAMTARYGAGTLAVQELWAWYKRVVGAEAVAPSPWFWGLFDDGTPIPLAARRFYRERPEMMALFPDPYEAGPRGFHSWLAASAPEVAGP